jgi:hypothetical protein
MALLGNIAIAVIFGVLYFMVDPKSTNDKKIRLKNNPIEL